MVEETGAGVDDLQKGDHVVMVFMPSCGHCTPCAEGRPALCEPGIVANTAGTLISGERRFRREGVPLNHQVGVSAFSEYAVMSRRSLVKIDRELPLDLAAVTDLVEQALQNIGQRLALLDELLELLKARDEYR